MGGKAQASLLSGMRAPHLTQNQFSHLEIRRLKEKRRFRTSVAELGIELKSLGSRRPALSLAIEVASRPRSQHVEGQGKDTISAAASRP